MSLKLGAIYKAKDAKTQEEKLIADLRDNLYDAEQAWVKLNKSSMDNITLFHTLYNAALAFTGARIKKLAEAVDPETRVKLVNDSKEMFSLYMDEIK